MLRQQREYATSSSNITPSAASAATAAAAAAASNPMASMMQMYQQAASAYSQPGAAAYTAQAAAAAGGIGVAQQELMRQQQAKMAGEMQMRQMQALKTAQAAMASKSYGANRPPEPGHMSKYGASNDSRDSRDSRGAPPPRDFQNRDRDRGPPRPGLGRDDRAPPPRRDDRPLERKRDDRPPMDRRRDTVTSPRGGDRRDVNRGKYLVKVSPFPYTTVDRDYQQLRLRYPKLHVAQDFTKVSAVWPDEKKSEDVINYPLQNPVNFWVGDKKYPNMLRRTSAEPLPKSQSSQPMKFNAKVMLVQVCKSTNPLYLFSCAPVQPVLFNRYM